MDTKRNRSEEFSTLSAVGFGLSLPLLCVLGFMVGGGALLAATGKFDKSSLSAALVMAFPFGVLAAIPYPFGVICALCGLRRKRPTALSVTVFVVSLLPIPVLLVGYFCIRHFF